MIIAEIRATIDSWNPLPAKPSKFIDPKTSTDIGNTRSSEPSLPHPMFSEIVEP
jgi:hypothetical protein